MLHDIGRINNSENFFSLNDKRLAQIYPTNIQSSPAKSSASSYRKPGKITRMACFWTLSNILLPHHIVVYSIQCQARIFKYIAMFVARLLNLSTA